MIKKYLEFIRESIKEDMDEGKFWKIDEDDIRQLEDSFKFSKFEMTFCKTP